MPGDGGYYGVLSGMPLHFFHAGKVVNIQRLNTVLDTLNGWYRDRGLFGQVQSLADAFLPQLCEYLVSMIM